MQIGKKLLEKDCVYLNAAGELVEYTGPLGKKHGEHSVFRFFNLSTGLSEKVEPEDLAKWLGVGEDVLPILESTSM